MAFTTYTAAVGPLASVAFNLPPVKETLQIDQSIPDTYTQPEEMAGEYDSSGTGTPFLAGTILPLVFYTAPRWLIAQGYGANFAGMMSALAKFNQAVVQGGLGTLVDTLPTGTTVSGSSVTSRACTCKVMGTPQYSYQNGAPICEITIQLKCPAGLWTYSPGGVLVPMH